MKPKFDYTKGEFVNTFGNFGMDWDGNFLHRISDNMAIDEDGDFRFIPGWNDDDDFFDDDF